MSICVCRHINRKSEREMHIHAENERTRVTKSETEKITIMTKWVCDI
jgi:hypothetical protein